MAAGDLFWEWVQSKPIRLLKLFQNHTPDEREEFLTETRRIADGEKIHGKYAGPALAPNLGALLVEPLQSPTCRLQFLSLEDTQLTSVRELGQALQSPNCKLTCLDLNNNQLTSIRELSEALQSPNCKLGRLSLSNNQLMCARDLSEALQSPNCKLTFLDLTHNRLTSTEDLSDALQSSHCKLTFLGLSGNNLNTRERYRLARAVRHPNCHLKDLSVTSNSSQIREYKTLDLDELNEQAWQEAIAHHQNELTEIRLRYQQLEEVVKTQWVGARARPGSSLHELRALNESRLENQLLRSLRAWKQPDWIRDDWKEVHWQQIHSLDDLQVSHRLGARTRHPQGGNRFYGVNAAAFSSTITADSWEQITAASPLLSRREPPRLVVRVVWNYDNRAVTRHLSRMADPQFQLLSIRDGQLPLHPNVLPILGHFVQREVPLLPDLVDVDPEIVSPRRLCVLYPQAQLNLSQLLSRRLSPLAEMEILHLAQGMAAGLLHLYQYQVIHRDFKLDNVLILWPQWVIETGWGEYLDQTEAERLSSLTEYRLMECIPVVADLDEHLNFSRVLQPELRQRKQYPLVTGQEPRGGAPVALSPEVLAAKLADGYLNYNSHDAWALGVVLFQMCSHPHHGDVIPFSGVDWHQMSLADIAALPSLPVDSLSPRFSAELRSVVVGLLHPDPDQRLTLLDAHSSLCRLLS